MNWIYDEKTDESHGTHLPSGPVHSMADLAEEVARFYGYDNIPTTLPTGEATTGKLSVQAAE